MKLTIWSTQQDAYSLWRINRHREFNFVVFFIIAKMYEIMFHTKFSFTRFASPAIICYRFFFVNLRVRNKFHAKGVGRKSTKCFAYETFFFHSNSIPTSLGVPPPPRTRREISQEHLELQILNFLTIYDVFSKKMNFNHLYPPWVTIAMPNVDTNFEQ